MIQQGGIFAPGGLYNSQPTGPVGTIMDPKVNQAVRWQQTFNPGGQYATLQRVDASGQAVGQPHGQGGGNFTLEDVLRMRGMGDQQFTAAGLPQINGNMMAGQGAFSVGMPGSSPRNATQVPATSLGDAWTGSDEQRALIEALLSYTPGE